MYHGSDPLLVQIAMDTGEIKSEVRNLSRRVERLERAPRLTWADIQPWVYGATILALGLAGKVDWSDLLRTLRP
jgi:hypothetical protein